MFTFEDSEGAIIEIEAERLLASTPSLLSDLVTKLDL